MIKKKIYKYYRKILNESETSILNFNMIYRNNIYIFNIFLKHNRKEEIPDVKRNITDGKMP